MPGLKGQRGATLTEMVVIMPLVILLGMTGLQVALLQQARLSLDYAVFEACRAGVRAHAGPGAIREAWWRAMTPLLSLSGVVPGSSLPANSKVAAHALRVAAMAGESPYLRIEILNPTREAFQDFNDPRLQQILKTGGAMVIPNDRLDQRPATRGMRSGLSIQEANYLRLRVTYGYRPRIPWVGGLFTAGMAWLGANNDPFRAALLASQRIPVVVETTMPMLGPAIENDWVMTDAGLPDNGGGNGEEDNGSGDGTDPGTGNGEGGTDPGGGNPTGGDEDFCTEHEVIDQDQVF